MQSEKNLSLTECADRLLGRVLLLLILLDLRISIWRERRE